jgi:hypothetical protein
MKSESDQKPMQPPRCGAKTRRNTPCGRMAMACGRCVLHGGRSTGPKTAEGLERLRVARTKHGRYSAENRQVAAMIREMRREARRLVELT